MKMTSARLGRVIIVRLEDGDILHECVEAAARRAGMAAAVCFFLGGADRGSRLVVGPRQGRAKTIEPMHICLDNVFEVAGVGTVFPGPGGKPVLHMHAACGRGRTTRSGCVRAGVRVWLIGEVVMIELAAAKARRQRDPATGFDLLTLGPKASAPPRQRAGHRQPRGTATGPKGRHGSNPK